MNVSTTQSHEKSSSPQTPESTNRHTEWTPSDGSRSIWSDLSLNNQTPLATHLAPMAPEWDSNRRTIPAARSVFPSPHTHWAYFDGQPSIWSTPPRVEGTNAAHQSLSASVGSPQLSGTEAARPRPSAPSALTLRGAQAPASGSTCHCPCAEAKE